MSFVFSYLTIIILVLKKFFEILIVYSIDNLKIDFIFLMANSKLI